MKTPALRSIIKAASFIALSPLLPLAAQNPAAYYSHVLFDNSLTPDQYFYSRAQASNTSTLAAVNGRLPVDSKVFHTPPNALRLQWQSNARGGWSATVEGPDIRNLPPHLTGDTLSFWCYSETALPQAALPLVQLADASGGFSVPLSLAEFMTAVPPRRWLQARIPLQRFASASFHPFDPARLRGVVFVQNATDGVEHSLVIDDIKVDF